MKIKIELELDTDKDSDLVKIEDIIEQLYCLRNIAEEKQKQFQQKERSTKR